MNFGFHWGAVHWSLAFEPIDLCSVEDRFWSSLSPAYRPSHSVGLAVHSREPLCLFPTWLTVWHLRRESYELGKWKGIGLKPGFPSLHTVDFWGLDHSLLWGLSCSLQGILQHPWFLPSRCQEYLPPNHDSHMSNFPWGAKRPPGENNWFRQMPIYVIIFSFTAVVHLGLWNFPNITLSL